MDVKTKIDKLRENNIERYLRNDFDLLRDLDIEKHDVEGYHGREVLELLQNVDDACEKNNSQNKAPQKVIASVLFTDGVLIVSNTGTKFDYEGIKALAIGHISTKDDNAIGSKGSGFRGVLNWSENIRIFSGEYKVGFSKEYTEKIYTENCTNENIKRQAEKYFKKEKKTLCFPMLSMPNYLEDNRDRNYDTVIEIVIDQEKNTGDYNLEKQLENFDYRVLLFLPHLNQIDITIDGKKKSFIKETITENGLDYVELNIIEDETDDQNKNQLDLGNKNIPETYIIKKQELDDLDGNKYLLIAVPLEKIDEYPLYCYFPTLETSPFPVLMHAPFSLSSDRNHIPTENSGYNKKLFEKLIILLTDISNRIVALDISQNKAVEIVTPNNLVDNPTWNFNGVFSKFNLQQHFLNEVKNLRIFPTVNKNFTNIRDGVKRLIEQAPSAFNGEDFELLLEYFSHEKSNILVSVIAKANNINIEYSDRELCEKINAKSLDIQEQIEIFLWWNRCRKSSLEIPNVLKDTNGNYIDCVIARRCFLPTETGINALPDEFSFVNLTVLDKAYMEELVKQIQENDEKNWQNIKTGYIQASNARILASYSDSKFALKFTEQSSKDIIIREINSQIKTQVQAMAYYIWLFELYQGKENIEVQSFERIDYVLPSIKGALPVSQLYFGEEWGNALGEKIFSIIMAESGSHDKLISPIFLGINENNQDVHKQFLSKLGVKKFPNVQKKYFDWRGLDSIYEFKVFVREKYNIEFNINHLDIYTIDGINNIIDGLSMTEIVAWINSDSNLYGHLLSIENNSNARQQNNWSGRHFLSNEYLIWVLNNTPWLEFSDIKYSPKQVVAYSKIGNKCEGLYGIDEKELISIVGNTLYKVLNFHKSLGELDSQEIKKLLLALPTFDKGEASRKLYEEVIKHKSDEESNYETIDIKVLCKDGKFYNAKEVGYAYGKLPKSISEKNKLIWISEKRSTSTISKWFGVERHKTTLRYDSSEASAIYKDVFNKEIEDLKIVVLSTIEMTKENISKIKRLVIEPHSNIKAKDSQQDDAIVALDDYSYIESTEERLGVNIFLMNLPKSQNNIKELFRNDVFASEVASIFKEALNLNINESFLELLVCRTSDGRKQKIAETYGVDRWNEAYEAIFEKTVSSKKIEEFLLENRISDKKIENAVAIDFSYPLSDTEVELIIDILEKCKITMNEFVEKINIDIDIRHYWIKKIQNYCDLSAEIYNTYLYEKLLFEDKNAQECFEQLKHKYVSFTPDIDLIPNSENFNVPSFVESNFNILKSVMKEISVNDIYKKNFLLLCEQVDNEQNFADFIDANEKLKSLIYFLNANNNYVAYIFEEYEKYRNKIVSNPTLIVDDKPSGSKGSFSIRKVEPKLGISKSSNSLYGGNSLGTQTTTQHNDLSKSRQNNGKIAEKIAYSVLKKEYSSLKWTSENAEIGLPERNTSRVYDMYYIENEKKIFVEIKVLSSEFYMSKAEYDFANEQGENHVIYFVDIENKELLQPAHLKDFELSKETSEYKFKIIVSSDKTG